MSVILAAAVAATRRRRRRGARVLFADDFDRADSATTLGDPWEAITGTWGVSSGKAYNPSATANAIAVVDAGVADCMISTAMEVRNTGSGLYFRVVDADNWLRWANASSTTMRLHKCIAGSVSIVATISGLTVNVTGDVYAVRCSGTKVTPYLNGVRVADPQTVADLATATKHGIGLTTGSTTPRWGDFRVLA